MKDFVRGQRHELPLFEDNWDYDSTEIQKVIEAFCVKPKEDKIWEERFISDERMDEIEKAILDWKE